MKKTGMLISSLIIIGGIAFVLVWFSKTHMSPKQELQGSSQIGGNDWKGLIEDFLIPAQNNTRYAFSLSYPSNWHMSEDAHAPGMPDYLFTAKNNPENTSDRSAPCIQFSFNYNGPVDANADAQSALSGPTDETILDLHVISTEPIEINGNKGIRRMVTGDNETIPTEEVLLLGGVSHVNDRFSGTNQKNVYTIHSCVGTDTKIFDEFLDSLVIKN